jgi:phosphoribosylanthranilate isomerase
MTTTKVKICGITNGADAAAAIEAGADALGFVFYPKSPRAITREAARDIIAGLPPFVTTVGVFVNGVADMVKDIKEFCRLDKLQLHGQEGPEYCAGFPGGVIKAVRIKDAGDIDRLKEYNDNRYNVRAFLLDAFVEGMPGGTGTTFDWSIAVEAKRYGRIILSGGLTPENVAEAVERVAPYAVDVSSGVELANGTGGVKDHGLVRRFIERVKGSR